MEHSKCPFTPESCKTCIHYDKGSVNSGYARLRLSDRSLNTEMHIHELLISEFFGNFLAEKVKVISADIKYPTFCPPRCKLWRE